MSEPLSSLQGFIINRQINRQIDVLNDYPLICVVWKKGQQEKKDTAAKKKAAAAKDKPAASSIPAETASDATNNAEDDDDDDIVEIIPEPEKEVIFGRFFLYLE